MLPRQRHEARVFILRIAAASNPHTSRSVLSPNFSADILTSDRADNRRLSNIVLRLSSPTVQNFHRKDSSTHRLTAMPNPLLQLETSPP